jgi:hypothetical protein
MGAGSRGSNNRMAFVPAANSPRWGGGGGGRHAVFFIHWSATPHLRIFNGHPKEIPSHKEY